MTTVPAAPRRILLGLIGAPISHSASPAIHEAAARAAGLRAHYHLIERAGLDARALRRILDGVRETGFAGLNVTFPYKEAVVPLLDELSPLAARIGAVNTITVVEGRLVGHNTDCTGFAAACAGRDTGRQDRAIALVGAGGVGKAIAVALARTGGPELRIVDSDRAKAAALAAALETLCAARAVTTVEDAVEGADGIVNATPVGMTPSTDSPVPAHLIRPGHWVADVVYTPLWTPLLKAAHMRGARVLTGRDLTLYQAADAFRLFTGVEPSLDAMSGAFDEVMRMRGGDPLAA